jgi:hypothetical protein
VDAALGAWPARRCAQLESRWDSAGARAIWDTAGIKVILGGVTDPDTLERLSRLCGEIALRTHSRTRDETGRRARTVTYQPVRVLPPELLRTLPEWRALIVRGNLSPVVVRLRMAWRRRDHRHAGRARPAPRRPLPVVTARRPRPQQPGLPGGGTRPLPGADGSRDPGEPEPQPTAPDDPARPWPAPGSVPRWLTPPLPDEHRPLRPRRPWDPPVDSGNRP